jgi:uncharacterized protein (TIGR02145 family)
MLLIIKMEDTNMKKLTLITMALMMGLMMLVSCKKDKDNNDGKTVFYANIESGNQGRTHLDPDFLSDSAFVLWSVGDKIKIYNGNGESEVFTLKSGANTRNAVFTFAGEFELVPPYVAVYPYTTEVDLDEGYVYYNVPAVQNITQPDTFAQNTNPMVAYSEDENLQFANLCGGIGVQLYGEGVHVSSITVLGPFRRANGEFMADYYDPDFQPNYESEGTQMITLTCDVTLPASADEAAAFYAVLPPGTLRDGVDIFIYDGDNAIGEIAVPEGHAAEVFRNHIKYFPPVEITLPDEHEYVNLGLPSGLLWATCNVGAETPEEYGDYFAWGETQPKDTYNLSTYQYCNGSYNTLTKYCNNSSYGYNGFTDDLTTLLPEDDAAAANWGNGWRMPTKEEFEELYNNTTVTWTQQNGVNGRLFTADNGNSLFLPAAGYRGSSSLYYAGSLGYYWSSSLYTDDPIFAWYFLFTSVGYGVYYNDRNYGHSVRAVRSSAQN